MKHLRIACCSFRHAPVIYARQAWLLDAHRSLEGKIHIVAWLGVILWPHQCGWAFVAAFVVAFVAASYRGCISLAALVAALEAAFVAASRLSKTNQANVRRSCKSEKLAKQECCGLVCESTHLFISAHHQLIACASDCSQIPMPSAELQEMVIWTSVRQGVCSTS